MPIQGLPATIISDNGPQFTSAEFKAFLHNKGISHSLCARHHPQSNGGFERFNRVLKEGLKTHLASGLNFKAALQEILFNYRVSKHSLTEYSPAELMVGRQLKQPLSAITPPSRTETDTPIINTNREILSKAISVKQDKVKLKLDEKRYATPSTFSEAEYVRIRRPQMGGKFRTQLSEPMKIPGR